MITAISIIAGGIINRSLGPSGAGDYAELTSWVTIFIYVFGLSAATAIFHFSNQKDYPYTRGELLGSVVGLWALTAALTVLGLCAALIFWPQYFSANFRTHLAVVVIFIFSTTGLTLFTTLLKVDDSFRFLSIYTVGSQMMLLTGICLLALFGRLNIAKLLLLSCGAQLLVVASSVFYFERLRPGWYPLRVNFDLIRKMVWAGLKVHVATVSTLLYVKLDQILLYNMAGNAETGIYAVAVNVTVGLLILPLAVQQVLYPRIINSVPENDAYATIRVTRYTFFFFALCLVFVYFLADPLIALYAGTAFQASTPLLRSLLAGTLLFSIPNLLSPYWVKKGYFLLASASALTLFVVNLLLNFLWIPRYGAKGSVWATNVTYFVGAVVSLVVFYYLSHQNPLRIFIFTRQDAATLYKQFVLFMSKRRAVPESL
jgi:O-antigen/teichoic acid export membrane protein